MPQRELVERLLEKLRRAGLLNAFSYPVHALPEDDYLAGIHHCAGAAATAAVGGQYGRVAISNPVGSKTLVIVERAKIWLNTAGGQYNVGIRETALTGLTTDHTDTRLPISVNLGSGVPTVAKMHSQTATPQTITTNRIEIGYTTDGQRVQQLLILPVILSPGFSYLVEAAIVNQQMAVSFKWREAFPAPDDLG